MRCSTTWLSRRSSELHPGGVQLQGDPELVVRGLFISIAIGMIGGLLPAIRAARCL